MVFRCARRPVKAKTNKQEGADLALAEFSDRIRQKAGSSSYHLSKSNVLARDSYVKVMHPVVCASPNASVVYLGEPFIHKHYKRHNDSLFDPSDDLDVQRKENHKGRRYCFIAGILDSLGMECQVVALDIFRGGKSTAKQPKDYHAMFNHDYFVKWFAKLLAVLGDMGVANAYIVMDNAKYRERR
ncbi:hypothetical protein DYB37_012858 [Aphanomyces astaci]|uniref:Uncharacterized protein n=1 Tax=Aphanomyces astaci TaxID=112090 RepID=A0A3R7AQL2_APHAT|nr:hypothetical protein DYB35_006872 [Aphanomyces astaci]RHZ03562.1 hypothetical protein DYB37_012858 [Aphanomyces astaci]